MKKVESKLIGFKKKNQSLVLKNSKIIRGGAVELIDFHVCDSSCYCNPEYCREPDCFQCAGCHM